MWQIPGDAGSPEIPGIPGLNFPKYEIHAIASFFTGGSFQSLQLSISGEDYPTKGLKDLCGLNPRNPGC